MKEQVRMNCGKCHKCGKPVEIREDGEWCAACQSYQRPRSHGFSLSVCDDVSRECPAWLFETVEENNPRAQSPQETFPAENPQPLEAPQVPVATVEEIVPAQPTAIASSDAATETSRQQAEAAQPQPPAAIVWEVHVYNFRPTLVAVVKEEGKLPRLARIDAPKSILRRLHYYAESSVYQKTSTIPPSGVFEPNIMLRRAIEEGLRAGLIRVAL